MTPELIATLCDHAQGNLRALMNMAGELLVYAAERESIWNITWLPCPSVAPKKRAGEWAIRHYRLCPVVRLTD